MAMGPIRRGHISCPTNIPPLLYHFQFNPAEVSISKTAVYDSEGLSKSKGASLLSASGRGAYLQAMNKDSRFSQAAGFVSTADAKRFSKEGDRTLNFKLFIDGTEPGPREQPGLRSPERMSIVDDLALLESFLVPAPGNVVDIGIAGKTTWDNLQAKREFQSDDWAALWYAQPPVASVGLGDISFDGWVTEMKTTIIQWSPDLEPIRAQVELSLVEKPDALGTLIGHIKRHVRVARGLYRQYETLDLEEDVF